MVEQKTKLIVKKAASCQSLEDIAESLKNKTILFVEDNYSSIVSYIEELEYQVEGVKIILRQDLQGALQVLSKKENPSQSIDFLLIDFHLPAKNFLPELQKYKDVMGDFRLNEGQMLGMWMDEHLDDLPYAYLTAYYSDFNPISEKQDKMLKLNKSEVAPHLLPEKNL